MVITSSMVVELKYRSAGETTCYHVCGDGMERYLHARDVEVRIPYIHHRRGIR